MANEEKIRQLCARLISFPDGSEEFHLAVSELNKELHDHVERLRLMTLEQSRRATQWKTTEEPDTHQSSARQSYRSREVDSADGFAEGLNLFRTSDKGPNKKVD